MNFYNTSAAYFDSNALYAGAQNKTVMNDTALQVKG